MTKEELVRRAVDGQCSEKFFEEFKNYLEMFSRTAASRQKKRKINEKDRDNRNKETRQSRSF